MHRIVEVPAVAGRLARRDVGDAEETALVRAEWLAEDDVEVAEDVLVEEVALQLQVAAERGRHRAALRLLAGNRRERHRTAGSDGAHRRAVCPRIQLNPLRPPPHSMPNPRRHAGPRPPRHRPRVPARPPRHR